MERKHSIITFKADEFMMAALENIPNKSEFIRSALKVIILCFRSINKLHFFIDIYTFNTK